MSNELSTRTKGKETAEEVVKRLQEDSTVMNNDPVVQELVKDAKYRMILGAIHSVEQAFNRSNRKSVKYGNTRRILRDLGNALDDLQDVG